ncbi:MAG TPA: GAF domain-containing protein [Drouetiella sp.]
MGSLNDCDKEPVQFVDSIQTFGSMIIVGEDGRIEQAAFSSELPKPASFALGKQFSAVFSSIDKALTSLIKSRSEPTVPILVKSDAFKKWTVCSGHKSGSKLVYEIEAASTEFSEQTIPTLKFQQERNHTIEEYLAYVCENLRVITHFDRVMVYRFSSDWHGQVIAESLSQNCSHSFYNHHFPASDIPEPARELFLRNWIRVIPDVDAVPIRLEKIDNSVQVDLTKSSLRAASPIHIEYLQMMGVKASMTISIVCDGKLWGLIACHHLSPKLLSAEHRSILSLTAKLISARVSTVNVTAVIRATHKLKSFLDEVAVHARDLNTSLLEISRDNKVALQRLVPCESFAYMSRGVDFVAGGNCPSPHSLEKIRQFLDSRNSDSFVTPSIVSDMPELRELSSTAAGIVAARIADAWFVWMRPEMSQTFTWAGNPEFKNLYINPSRNGLSPRASFDSWRSETSGRAKEWAQSEIDTIEKLKEHLATIVNHGKWLVEQKSSRFRRQLRASIKEQSADLQKELGDNFAI